jgi:iron complex outermembrane receptor protein
MPRWAKDQYNSDETDSYEADIVGKYQWGDTSLRVLAGYADRVDSYHQYGHVRGNWNTPYDWNMTNPATWDRYYIGSDSYALRWDNSEDKNHDKGYYAGMTLGLFKDRLMVLAGARSTANDKSGNSVWLDNTPEAIKAGTAGPGSLASPNHHAAATTPQAGVLYKLTPEVSVYASYSKSFVPANDYLLKAWVRTGEAKPTYGSGYEAGIKTSLFDGRISSTLTVYDILNNDILRHVDYSNPANPSQILEDTVQSGQDESKGIEFDINYSPVNNWQVYASYSYDDAGVKNDVQFPNRVGRRLVNSVRNTANLWTKYNFTTGVLKNAFIGGGFNYIGGQVYDETPGTYREKCTLLNAIAGYDFKAKGFPMTLTLNGKNLSNKLYRPGVAGNGRPRELQLTLTTKF